MALIEEIIKDYWFAALLVVLIAIYLFVKWKGKQPKVPKKETKVDIPVTNHSQKPNVEKEYEAMFDAATASDKVKIEDNLTEGVSEMSKLVHSKSKEIEKTIAQDIVDKEKLLENIVKNKDLIQKYGQDLSSLYRKFQDREKTIAMTLVGLKRVAKDIEKNKQTKLKP